MLFINCSHSRMLPTKSFFGISFTCVSKKEKKKKRKRNKVLFLNKISFVVADGLRCVGSVRGEHAAGVCLIRGPKPGLGS